MKQNKILTYLNKSKQRLQEQEILAHSLEQIFIQKNNQNSNSKIKKYQAYIPISKKKNYPHKINCKGCGKNFGSYRGNHCYGYYKNCIDQCFDYKNLGLLRKCDKCMMLFLNQAAFSIHILNTHKFKKSLKPIWMSQGLYSRVSTHGYKKGGTISCQGCNQVFNKYFLAKTLYPELGYYVHCIEKCHKYKKLDLITKCPHCPLIFMDSKSCATHIGHSKSCAKSDAELNDRKWLPPAYKVVSMMFQCNASVNCKGFHQKFPAFKLKRNPHPKPRVDYFIHCIEQCDQYKKLDLIRECSACSCKFINQFGLNIHFTYCLKSNYQGFIQSH